MLLPVRAIRFFQSTPACTHLACVSDVLERPILQSVPVEDIIGIEYARDLEVTQGFYLLLMAYAALRVVRVLIFEAINRSR